MGAAGVGPQAGAMVLVRSPLLQGQNPAVAIDEILALALTKKPATSGMCSRPGQAGSGVPVARPTSPGP